MKTFTERKLQEFDKKWETLFCVKAFKKDKNYVIGDRNYLKTHLKESIEQAKEEERGRIIDNLDKVLTNFDTENRSAGELMDAVIKVRSDILNNQDK